MGESPDRSNRTAGAEEQQEAERSTAEAVTPAAPTPTDSPTRTLRPRDAREEDTPEEREEETDAAEDADDAEANADAEADAEADEHADAAEPKVDAETRLLRGAVIEKAPEAAEAAGSEAAGDGEPEASGEADPEEPESAVADETRLLRAAVVGKSTEAAAVEQSGSAERSESAESAAGGGDPEEAEPESAVDDETRLLRAAVIEKTPEAEPAAEDEPEDPDEAEDEDGAEAETDEEPEPEAAADPEPEAGPDLEPEAGTPPVVAGPRSVADEETRPMSAFPPLPPPPGPSRPAGTGAEPARGLPAGATAVADSPETTVEAMEVLAGLSARPMTPARIALRRVRLYGVLLVLLVLVLGTVQALRPLPSPKLQQSAVGSYAFAGGRLSLAWPANGQAAVSVPGLGSMGKSGSGNPVPLASVTKMMTAYIVLHDHPLKTGELGPTITVDQGAVDDYNTGSKSGESVQKVAPGEKLTEYKALQMLMIPSANNIARLLGRWDAGTDAAFVQKMQATAAQLGMTQSTYTDPSGLDATTRSNADDQLKLATAAMADPVFREVVGTQSFDSPLNGLTPNTNTLVGHDGVIGIKTGTSTAALGNLVWAAEQSVGGVDQLIVGVTLSQPAIGSGPGQGILDQVLANSKKLVVSAEQALQGHTIAHKGDVVGYVDDGMGGRTPVVATADVQVAGWSGLSVDVSLRPLDGKAVPHSAAAGTVVGELVVGSGPTAQTVPVALQSGLTAPGFGAKLTRLT
ncbi:D-alanyl-D-alanine carboxypeptidase [Streptacidiphilus melanogenes]|uniref:D-alanyl-D-alanine carboxypeptidase n=1 Tax=Streptacidiphilus melanogenes TaxID=411235 RepID=UPI000693BD9E|nr:D-alanyl-D-alanine carboxypeptidase [Streptacidiphilus melanogenes]